jgi:Mg/Co/Ni transporter MgtE
MHPNQKVLEDFLKKHPFSAAQALEQCTDEEAAEFLQNMPKEQSIKLLNLTNAEKASRYFTLYEPQKKMDLMRDGEIFLIVSLLRPMEVTAREHLLEGLTMERSMAITRKLEQVPNTVGALMEPAIVVQKESPVEQAVEIIRRNLHYVNLCIYVVDMEGTFKGYVGSKELLLADPLSSAGESMSKHSPKFLPNMPVKYVIDHPAWFEFGNIPVVDSSERILGSLYHSSIIKNSTKTNRPTTKEILETGGALGELYLVGLTALLGSKSNK